MLTELIFSPYVDVRKAKFWAFSASESFHMRKEISAALPMPRNPFSTKTASPLLAPRLLDLQRTYKCIHVPVCLNAQLLSNNKTRIIQKFLQRTYFPPLQQSKCWIGVERQCRTSVGKKLVRVSLWEKAWWQRRTLRKASGAMKAVSDARTVHREREHASNFHVTFARDRGKTETSEKLERNSITFVGNCDRKEGGVSLMRKTRDWICGWKVLSSAQKRGGGGVGKTRSARFEFAELEKVWLDFRCHRELSHRRLKYWKVQVKRSQE